MLNAQDFTPLTTPPPMAGRFSWVGLFLVVLIAPVFGLVWAWAAEVAQHYFAPVILFPILLGLFVGLSVVGLVRFAQIGHRPTIMLAVVLAAVVAAAGQHVFGYLAAYYWPRHSLPPGAAGVDLSALVREMRPSFAEYIEAQARRGRPLPLQYTAHGWAAWATWGFDGLLVVLGAVVAMLPAIRVPYCNRCGSWYRTVRCGKLDQPTAQRFARSIGVEGVESYRKPRYRLSVCQGGCGPTRLEMTWEQGAAAVDLVQAWLDAAARNQATALLDAMEGDRLENEQESDG